MKFITIKLLIFISYIHDKTWLLKHRKEPNIFQEYKNRRKYPQTWNVLLDYRSKVKHSHIAKIIEYLCGILTKHEISETEWGYGLGDNMCDYWCRWCNKHFQMPRREEISDFRTNLMKDIEDDQLDAGAR